MKNKRGEVVTLLTLGVVFIGAIITVGSSFLINNKKNLASNPRASTVNCTYSSQNLCKEECGLGLTCLACRNGKYRCSGLLDDSAVSVTATKAPTRTPTKSPTATPKLVTRPTQTPTSSCQYSCQKYGCSVGYVYAGGSCHGFDFFCCKPSATAPTTVLSGPTITPSLSGSSCEFINMAECNDICTGSCSRAGCLGLGAKCIGVVIPTFPPLFPTIVPVSNTSCSIGSSCYLGSTCPVGSQYSNRSCSIDDKPGKCCTTAPAFPTSTVPVACKNPMSRSDCRADCAGSCTPCGNGDYDCVVSTYPTKTPTLPPASCDFINMGECRDACSGVCTSAGCTGGRVKCGPRVVIPTFGPQSPTSSVPGACKNPMSRSDCRADCAGSCTPCGNGDYYCVASTYPTRVPTTPPASCEYISMGECRGSCSGVCTSVGCTGGTIKCGPRVVIPTFGPSGAPAPTQTQQELFAQRQGATWDYVANNPDASLAERSVGVLIGVGDTITYGWSYMSYVTAPVSNILGTVTNDAIGDSNATAQVGSSFANYAQAQSDANAAAAAQGVTRDVSVGEALTVGVVGAVDQVDGMLIGIPSTVVNAVTDGGWDSTRETVVSNAVGGADYEVAAADASITAGNDLVKAVETVAVITTQLYKGVAGTPPTTQAPLVPKTGYEIVDNIVDTVVPSAPNLNGMSLGEVALQQVEKNTLGTAREDTLVGIIDFLFGGTPETSY